MNLEQKCELFRRQIQEFQSRVLQDTGDSYYKLSGFKTKMQTKGMMVHHIYQKRQGLHYLYIGEETFSRFCFKISSFAGFSNFYKSFHYEIFNYGGGAKLKMLRMSGINSPVEIQILIEKNDPFWLKSITDRAIKESRAFANLMRFGHDGYITMTDKKNIENYKGGFKCFCLSSHS